MLGLSYSHHQHGSSLLPAGDTMIVPVGPSSLSSTFRDNDKPSLTHTFRQSARGGMLVPAEPSSPPSQALVSTLRGTGELALRSTMRGTQRDLRSTLAIPDVADPESSSPMELNKVALQDMFRSLNGKAWARTDNWCIRTFLGAWYGVRDVEGDGTATEITLPRNGLDGKSCLTRGVPAMAVLDRCQCFEGVIAGMCPLTGVSVPAGMLPDTIGNLQKLKSLVLHENHLTGPSSHKAAWIPVSEDTIISRYTISL
jgi:hypothetical protein